MIKALLQRLKVDWREYVNHTLYMNDMRRDRRRIKRAIQSAQLKNSIDGRKYYILRDLRGFPAAYNRDEIKWLKERNIIDKNDTHLEMSRAALAIVTSNKVEMQQYTAVQAKKEEE